MIHGSQDLLDFTIQAADGELGQVREIYIDDFNWVVRYIAVDVEGGSILLSPVSLTHPDPDAKILRVDHNLEFILNSPRFDLDQPVTRVRETELHNYFNWPFYWIAPGLISNPLIDLTSEMKAEGTPAFEEDPENQHLRSARSLLGDPVAARDGMVGNLDDFLIDDTSWNILYMILDTGTLLPGKKVLIAPQWVQNDWSDNQVHIDLSRDTIMHSPIYDPSVPIDPEYERKLREHYERKE